MLTILILLIIVTILVFVVMWKTTSASVKLNENKYDEAYQQTKSLAIMNGILFLILVVIDGFMIYLHVNPQAVVTRRFLNM